MYNQPANDKTLNEYAQAIATLYHKLKTTPLDDWNQLTQQVEAIRQQIEAKIDAWMALDEQLDEIVQAFVSESDLPNVSAPNVSAPDVSTPHLSESQLPDVEAVEPQSSGKSVSDNAFAAPSSDASADVLFNVSNPSPEHGDPLAASLRKAMGFYDLWLFEEASTLFRQVLRYEPNNLLAALFYAAAQTTQGNYQSAHPYIEHIRRSGNRRYQCAAEEIAANGHYTQGNLLAAVDCLLRVVHFMPDYQDTWFNLGLCYAKLEDWSAAAGALSQALELNDEDTSARELLVDVWVQLEEYDAALAKTEAGLQLRPGHSGLLRRKAKILSETGHLNRAEQLYREVLLQNPRQAEFYEEYADVCLFQGKMKQATAILKKSLSIFRNNESHVMKLAVIELLEHQSERAGDLIRQPPLNSKHQPLIALCQAQLLWNRRDYRQANVLIQGALQSGDRYVRNLALYFHSRFLTQSGRTEDARQVLRQVETN